MPRRWAPPWARARKYQVDQVLFCPGGEVQETGAANFLLIRDGEMLTRSLDTTFLHGVTRDSLLTLARDRGFKVSERVFEVEEMLEWVKSGEAALSGTAAVLAGVGTLIYRGTEHRVASGEVGPLTRALRAQLRGDSTGRGGRSPRLAAARCEAGLSRDRSVLFAVLVVLVVEVVVVIVVVIVFLVVPVLVVVFLLCVFLGLRARPALGLLGELEVELRPAVDVQFLDVAVEMLNLDDFAVLIHLEDLEGLVVLQILIPLPDGRFVLSSHVRFVLLSSCCRWLMRLANIRGGRSAK